MSTIVKSKHAVVSRAPYILYMMFVDMRNFVQFLPEDKKNEVTADYDSIKATVQGFNVGRKSNGRKNGYINNRWRNCKSQKRDYNLASCKTSRD